MAGRRKPAWPTPPQGLTRRRCALNVATDPGSKQMGVQVGHGKAVVAGSGQSVSSATSCTYWAVREGHMKRHVMYNRVQQVSGTGTHHATRHTDLKVPFKLNNINA